jgi:hypothetical protein
MVAARVRRATVSASLERVCVILGLSLVVGIRRKFGRARGGINAAAAL